MTLEMLKFSENEYEQEHNMENVYIPPSYITI